MKKQGKGNWSEPDEGEMDSVKVKESTIWGTEAMNDGIQVERKKAGSVLWVWESGFRTRPAEVMQTEVVMKWDKQTWGKRGKESGGIKAEPVRRRSSVKSV